MDWEKDIDGLGVNTALPHFTDYSARLEVQTIQHYAEIKTIFNDPREQVRKGVRRFGASPAADTILDLFRQARSTGVVIGDRLAFWTLCEKELSPALWANIFNDAMELSDRAFVAGYRLSLTDAYNIMLLNLIDNTATGFITEQRGFTFLGNYKKNIAWAWASPVQDKKLGADALGVELLPDGTLKTIVISFKSRSYVPGLMNLSKVSPALRRNRHKEHVKHLALLEANPSAEIWIVYEHQDFWAVMDAMDVPCPDCKTK